MKLLEMLPAGIRHATGDYDFTAQSIIAFAREFDPHPFHIDAEEAKKSVFGGLCASGWHVCAANMRAFIGFMDRQNATVMARGLEPPKIGPSPGVRNLKWLKPVFAEDRIEFFLTVHSSQPIEDHPGHNMCQMTFEGENAKGERVLSFDCAMVEFV